MQRDLNVADHLQSPLKRLYLPDSEALDELNKLRLDTRVKEDLEQRGTLLSDEDGANPDIFTLLSLFYLVNKLKNLANLSMLAAARPTANNAVKSRWIMLTGKYLSGMRNAKGLCLPVSQYAKQPD